MSGEKVGRRVCVVTAGGLVPSMMVNVLGEAFGSVDVIVEQPESRDALLAIRRRRIGGIRVAGQRATMMLLVLVKKLVARRSRQRLAELGVADRIAPHYPVHRVESVNSDAFLRTIGNLAPDIVMLCGCRIVRADILRAIGVPVLNYHAGITPAYRGMNGGYWALASGDAANFGATVHFVDAGVDTGDIVMQVRGQPVRGDGLWSYPVTQAQMSRQMWVEAITTVLDGTARRVKAEGPSRQWYDPEIWRYVWTGLTRGVW